MLVKICKHVLANMQDGTCSITYQHSDGKLDFETVEINGKGSTKKKKSLFLHKVGPDGLKPSIVVQ